MYSLLSIATKRAITHHFLSAPPFTATVTMVAMIATMAVDLLEGCKYYNPKSKVRDSWKLELELGLELAAEIRKRPRDFQIPNPK